MGYRLTVPQDYRPALSIIEIEEAIKLIKDFFERNLAAGDGQGMRGRQYFSSVDGIQSFDLE